MLCHRGCNLTATYTNYKGLPCCSKQASKCPIVKEKIGKKTSAALLGRKHTDERKELQSKNLKEAWATGKRGKPETIEKIRNGVTEYWKSNPRDPWNKGKKGSQVAWNKGLRKQEPIEIILRNDPVYSDFKKYRNRIAVRTKKTYMLYEEEINPQNLPLGKCGIEGAHQIDHILTVRQGFEQGISIEEMSAKENLQIIHWLDNVKKYDGKGLRKNNGK
jgi:hypothetical protein